MSPQPENMPDKIEKSYLAGVIDCDGSIILYQNRKHYDTRIDVCQAKKENLEKLQAIWGGHIQKGTRGEYHLIWRKKQDVIYILESVLHFLKFKVDQAGIVLLYLDEVAKGSGFPIDKKYGKNLFDQMRLLKKEAYAS